MQSPRPCAPIRVRLRARGRVQGVWFRGFVKDQACALGLQGFAENLPDGTVRILAQGDAEAVEKLILACQGGPPAARVDALERAAEPIGDELRGFEIR